MSIANEISLVGKDFRESLRSWRFWVHFAIDDILKQYRRSYIGPVWITLGTGIFILTFGVIGSEIFNVRTKDYIPYFAAGHITFLFISQGMIEGCATYTSSSAFIKQAPFPKVAFVLRVVLRNLIVFLHNLPILLITLLVCERIHLVNILNFGIGLAVVCIFLILVNGILGVVSARYRDIPLMVVTVMQISLFLTPVLWSPTQLRGDLVWAVYLNPLYAYIDIVRSPLLGAELSVSTVPMIMATLGMFFVLFLCVFARSRNRIVFWV
jgi:lipopolysaccharide transport system permease protein